tara:strand:+ start:181 stop:375 length:195 start_codon:yes stop_codon:yes gene_type:complete
MANLKQKSYLITNIPLGDWRRFKKWTALEEFDNLNHALLTLVRRAGNNQVTSKADGIVNDTQTT